MIKLLQTQDIPFKNYVEEAAYHFLLDNFKPERILYEAWTFNLDSGSYTPDFVMVVDDRLVFFEVKSSWNAPGADRTKRAIKSIASDFHWLGIWCAIVVDKKHQKDGVKYIDSWHLQIVKGNRLSKTTKDKILEMLKEKSREN